MRTLPWNRGARVAEVRDRIWSYVSPSSRYELPGLLVAAALLKWPEADALRLGELQFLLSEQVGDLLTAMPQLVRRLATASANEETWAADRLRGPVQWNRTLSLRAATGSQLLYVTTPAERVYDTPENGLLVHVLDAIVRAGTASGWDQTVSREEPASVVRERLAQAARWQQHRMLQGVARVRPDQRSLARIRVGRRSTRYGPVLAAYDKLVSLVEHLDRQAIREAIEQAALVTASEATLFELLTAFRLIDSLSEHGWPVQPFHLFHGSVQTRAQRQDGRQLTLWYQSTPPSLATGSRYRQVLASHGFAQNQELRPDFVLRWTDLNGQTRWLVVECKLRERTGVRHAARQALADLLSYRRSFDAALTTCGAPYGLGVAWGSGLQPNCQQEIALCTPDLLTQAVGLIVL